MSESAAWQQIASDSAIQVTEERITSILAIQAEEFSLSHELERYYWNGGPHTTQVGGTEGHDLRYSYTWNTLRKADPEAGKVHTIGNPSISPLSDGRGLTLTDPIIEVMSSAPVPDSNVKIVQAGDNLYYLLDADERALSAGYKNITHKEGNDFLIPGWDKPGILHLLTRDERVVVEAKSDRYRVLNASLRDGARTEMRERKMSLIPKVLAYCGISKDMYELDETINTISISTSLAGRAVELTDWSDRLALKSRFSKAVFPGRLSNEFPDEYGRLMFDADGNAVPEYEEKIMGATMCFNYQDISLQTPRLSDSIPVAVAVARLSMAASNQLTHMERGLFVTGPGQVEARLRPLTYDVLGRPRQITEGPQILPLSLDGSGKLQGIQ